MKILTVHHAIPTRAIDTEWILDKIRRRNAGRLDGAQLLTLEGQIVSFLQNAGSEMRYQLADGERAIDFALAASRRALESSRSARPDVDFVIYAGVGRGWLEPAMAHVIQSELGLVGASCFDVTDGCASWLRALHVAHSFIKAGTYRCGLIVTCECGFEEYGQWDVSSLEDFGDYLATFTIGEAATATVVSDADLDDDFYFRFRSFGRHYGLCMIPLPSAPRFLTAAVEEQHTRTKFFASSGRLFATAIDKIIETFESDARVRQQSYDIIFGHEASEKASRLLVKRLGLPPERYFPTHRAYGNTVASGVPLGMSLALEQGRLLDGAKVLVVVAASGITVGIATFSY